MVVQSMRRRWWRRQLRRRYSRAIKNENKYRKPTAKFEATALKHKERSSSSGTLFFSLVDSTAAAALVYYYNGDHGKNMTRLTAVIALSAIQMDNA